MSLLSRSLPGRRTGIALAALVCAALVGGTASPVWADGDGEGTDPGSAVVGPFGIGDALESSIDERDGAFTFGIPLGGVHLAWDSRAGTDDRFGFGPRWKLGVAGIETTGGVAVAPPAGGRYPSDETHPSGLAGYGIEDVVFEQSAGVLPPRTTTPVGAPVHGDDGIAYAYVLHELGGRSTYFSAAGDPVARVTALAEQTHWLWHELVPHRLLAIVSPDGVLTELDWESEPGTVVITPARNLPGELDPLTGERAPVPSWRVQLDGGRVDGILDPAGGRVSFDYDESGALTRITGVSGATTEIAWRAFDDGAQRTARVSTVDAGGHELSVRTWETSGDGTPSSGWPAYGGERELFDSGDPALRYRTTVSDGATGVISEYNSQHLLVERRMVVTTPSGEHVIQEQAFTYPGTSGGGVPDPAALPAAWARPVESEVTYHGRGGDTRAVTESTTYDPQGRERSRTATDGTVTVTDYDATVPEGRLLPIGVVTGETVTAPDGTVAKTVHTLDEARIAVIATETYRGHETGAVDANGETGETGGLERTGRTEFDLSHEGFVTAERVYPAGDPSATPATTTWDRRLDLAEGTLTATKTVAAGTSIAATTTEVSSLRHGGKLASIDALGNVSRAGYDQLGRAVTGVDAAGNATVGEIETAQQHGRNATTLTTPDGVAVTEVRDPLGRITRILDNIRGGRAVDGHERIAETREYPRPGTVKVIDAWGAATTTRTDVFGREVEVIGPTGMQQIAEYDDVADTATSGVTETGSLADAERTVTQTRDASGRVTAMSGTRADGVPVPETTTAYDGLGRATTTENGAVRARFSYDSAGNRVTTTLDPARGPDGAVLRDATDLSTATRRFDGFGVSLEKTLSGGGDVRSGGSRTVDELGRTATTTDQLDRLTSIEYTVDGLIAEVTSGSGQVTRNEYDPVHRRLVVRVVSSPIGDTVSTSYEYDPVTGLLTDIFDPAEPDATRIRSIYDAHGSPLTVTYPNGKQIEYRYDDHGRLTHLVDVAGNITEHRYTAEGLLARVEQRTASGAELAGVSYEYDRFGRVITQARDNGVTTETTFTSASQPATDTTTGPTGAVQTHREYTYDPRGNLIERVDIASPDTDERTEIATAYTYDAFDRLIASATRDADEPGGGVTSTAYELTVSGDIRSETTESGAGTPAHSRTVEAFEYDPLGALVARTTTRTDAGQVVAHVRTEQSWDDAGNLTRSFDGVRYDYDAANRPVSETTADGVITTEYWADGSRASITRLSSADTADVTEFYWSAGLLVNDVHRPAYGPDSHGDPSRGKPPPAHGVAGYLIGAARHARSAAGSDGATTISYYGADRHGNITDLSDVAGDVTARYRYTDYGSPVPLPGGAGAPARAGDLNANPFGYAGEYTNPTGTQHLGERTYLPDEHRFSTLDSAELHNLYAYADLNPITGVDPSGRNREFDWVTFAHGLAIAAGIALTIWNIGSLWQIGAATTMAVAEHVAVAAGVQAGRTFVDGLVAFFSTALDLGGSAVAATMVYHDTVAPVSSDKDLINGLRWAENAAGAGLAGSLYLSARMWTSSAKVIDAIKTQRAALAESIEHSQASITFANKPLPPADIVTETSTLATNTKSAPLPRAGDLTKSSAGPSTPPTRSLSVKSNPQSRVSGAPKTQVQSEPPSLMKKTGELSKACEALQGCAGLGTDAADEVRKLGDAAGNFHVAVWNKDADSAKEILGAMQTRLATLKEIPELGTDSAKTQFQTIEAILAEFATLL